jgi:hypothetical protein
MIEAGFITLLLNEPSISALVGANIKPLILPTNSPIPAITYQIVGGQSTPTLTTIGLQKIRVQLDCWGESYLHAATVRSALIKFLNLRSAALSDGTYLQSAQLIQPLDFFDEGGELYRCGCEFYLYFNLPSQH